MDNHDKTIINSVKVNNLSEQFKQFDVDNHNEHRKLFEALENINRRLTQIETKLSVEKEKDKQILTIRMWLIGLLLSATTFALTWVMKR